MGFLLWGCFYLNSSPHHRTQTHNGSPVCQTLHQTLPELKSYLWVMFWGWFYLRLPHHHRNIPHISKLSQPIPGLSHTGALTHTLPGPSRILPFQPSAARPRRARLSLLSASLDDGPTGVPVRHPTNRLPDLIPRTSRPPTTGFTNIRTQRRKVSQTPMPRCSGWQCLLFIPV